MSMESPESSLQLDLLAWYEVNKKSVFYGLGLIVIVAAVSIAWKHNTETKLEASSQALLDVRLKAGDTNALPVAELVAVAEKFPGTAAAAQATLLSGRELFLLGKFTEARAKFDSLASDNSSPLQPVALYGVAACFDAEDKTSEALQAYQAVISLPSAASLAQQARLAKARVHESLKQAKEAVALYSEVAAVPGSGHASDALLRKAALLRSHPELDTPAVSTNSVKVVAPKP
jgi:tetratricopeptide (TPR) repeat protein